MNQTLAPAGFVPVELAGTAEPAPASGFTRIDIPRIGAPWPDQGGLYAGICRGAPGQPDYHLILSLANPIQRMTWQQGMDWAATVKTNEGLADFSLPMRAEAALLYANLRDQFEPTWHWTGEQYSARYAWFQWFGDGCQYGSGKGYEGRVRAVRRLVIQSFNPS